MSDEEVIEYEEDLSGEIANLSAAFSNLMEIDSSLLSKGRQAKLARMKRQIFDAVAYYCDYLPEIEKEED